MLDPTAPRLTTPRAATVSAALPLALFLLFCACQAALASYVPGEVLVRFRPQTSLAAASERHQDLGARVAGSLPALGVQRLRLPPGLSVEEAVRRYRALPEVELAQPNYIYKVAAEPDDPGYSNQWHLPQISAPAAWDTVQGSGSVVVAVVDTGVDYDHEDIVDNIWPGRGWDFFNDDPDPVDDYAPLYHGTHIAGVIGAVGNNGIGVAGVCWQVQIMALKALGSDGTGSDATVAAAITYAANNGAQVINLSMESDAPDGPLSPLLEEAITYAQERDVLVVCAAGNYGVNVDISPVYPGSFPEDNILSVASTTTTDSLAYDSDWGLTSVDLAAPGESILSLSAADSYDALRGTSLAAAVTSGAAALLLAAHPDLSYRQLKGYLIHYCDDAGLPVLSRGRLNVAEALSAADNGLPWDAASRSSSEGGGGCFIATAAFRSPLAGEVRLLYAFRDRWLNNPLGRPLVAAYYLLSPPAARYIRERPWLPPLVRAVLRPALPLVRVSLAAPALLGCLLGALGIAAAWRRLPRRS
jgi:thermitase